MKRPFRSAVLPVVTMCLFAGACTAIEPLTEQGAAPAWVRDRLANDVEGRKAPPSIPVNEITAGDAARLDRDAAEGNIDDLGDIIMATRLTELRKAAL